MTATVKTADDAELLAELIARGVIRQRGAPRKKVIRESLTVRILPGLRAWIDTQPGTASKVVERALLAAQAAEENCKAWNQSVLARQQAAALDSPPSDA